MANLNINGSMYVDENLIINVDNNRRSVNELFKSTTLCPFGMYWKQSSTITLSEPWTNFGVILFRCGWNNGVNGGFIDHFHITLNSTLTDDRYVRLTPVQGTTQKYMTLFLNPTDTTKITITQSSFTSMDANALRSIDGLMRMN